MFDICFILESQLLSIVVIKLPCFLTDLCNRATQVERVTRFVMDGKLGPELKVGSSHVLDLGISAQKYLKYQVSLCLKFCYLKLINYP